jgi:MFS family permease
LGRPFGQLWLASGISGLGDGLAVAAFPLLAVSLTTSPGLVAGLVVAQRLPWLLLALPAGALADRLERLRAMAVVDVARAAVVVVVAALTLGGGLSLPVLYAAAFSLGALETIFSAAAHATVPALVGDDGLDRANGYLFATQSTTEFLVGPAIGGAVFVAAAALPFAVDAVSFLASAALVATIPRRLPAPPRAGDATIRGDMKMGLTYFRSSPLLRVLAVLVGGLALCQAMTMSVLVLYALNVLDLGRQGFGLLLGVGAVGNILGGLLASPLRDRVGAWRVLTAGATAAAVAYLVIGTTSSAAVAAVMLVVEALGVACGSVVALSLRQTAVPDELRGRVGNLFRTCVWGAIPIGAIAGGAVAEVVGLRATFIIPGVAQLVLVAITAPRLRAHVARAGQ